MADAPVFQSSVVRPYAVSPGAPLTLRDQSDVTKMLVRAAAETAAAAQLGVGFGSSRAEGDALVLGQRPGEWLIVGDVAAVDAVVGGLDRTGHVSVVDHTHSRLMFRLTGVEATAVLEKVCGLDWSDTMTPNGAVVSASLAKVGCDIARNDEDGTRSYLIAADRSYGQYLFDALLDAGEEFAL